MKPKTKAHLLLSTNMSAELDAKGVESPDVMDICESHQLVIASKAYCQVSKSIWARVRDNPHSKHHISVQVQSV